MDKVRVGITIGDINGIGPEVIIKTLSHDTVQSHCCPIIYGSSKVLAYHKNVVKASGFSFKLIQDADHADSNKINVINCWKSEPNIQLGVISQEAGECAQLALDRAIEDAKKGSIDVLLTAPIHKKAMASAGFPYAGHTDYLAQSFESKPLMLMVQDTLRVALVTTHIALKDVSTAISKQLIEQKLQILHKTLIKDYGIEKPNIAVLGVNPHASDNGLMGDEEEQIIRPLIIEKRKSGQLVAGPFAADGFFGSRMYAKFDAILASYHDQGLIGFKTLSFGNGVNVSAGLPIVRTSPDHGTGFDIVGKNIANPSSFRAALYEGIDIFRNRLTYKDNNQNPLKKNQYIQDEEHT